MIVHLRRGWEGRGKKFVGMKRNLEVDLEYNNWMNLLIKLKKVYCKYLLIMTISYVLTFQYIILKIGGSK